MRDPAHDAQVTVDSPALRYEKNIGGIISGRDDRRRRVLDTGQADVSVPLLDEPAVADTFYEASGLAIGTSYYWRVRAANAGGVGDWSSTFKFTTSAVPGAPELISPQDDAADVSRSPALEWNVVAGATGYRVQVAADPGFSTIWIDTTGVASTRLNLPGLANEVLHYWRVAAFNAQAVGDWSSPWRFTTINTPPQSPAIERPSDAAHVILGGGPGEDPVSPESQLEVAWSSAPDPDGDDVSFTWQLASSEDFATPWMSEDVGTETQVYVDYGSLADLLAENGIGLHEEIWLFLAAHISTWPNTTFNSRWWLVPANYSAHISTPTPGTTYLSIHVGP